MSRKTLDGELVKNLVGIEPLGKSDLDPTTEALSTTYSDELGVESDRLRHFESDLTCAIESQAVSPKKTDEAISGIIDKFDTVLPDYRTSLSPENQKLLIDTLRVRCEQVSDIKKDEVAYRTHALIILEDINEIFEHDLRQKIKQNMPLTHTKKKGAETLHSKGKPILALRSATRWFLWVASAYTTWEGICKLVEWASDPKQGYLPLDSTGAKLLEVALGIPAAIGMSEMIRQGKSAAEFIGVTRNVNLLESSRILFRERKKFAVALLLVIAPDVYTNINGAVEIFLGKKDNAEQLAEAVQKVDGNKKLIADKLVAGKSTNMADLAGKEATKALIDEAIGTYSKEQGLGPRFYGLAAAYFSGTQFDLVNGSDARCQSVGTPETYKGWTIVSVNNDSWCAYGKIGQSVKGWIVGPASQNTETIEQKLSNLASTDSSGRYNIAMGEYTNFHAVHGTNYIEEINQAWKEYIGKLDTDSSIQLTKIDETTATWEVSMQMLELQEDLALGITPAFKEIATKESALRSEMDKKMETSSHAYSDFDSRLVQKVDPKGGAVQIPPPKFRPLDLTVPPIEVSGGEVRSAFDIAMKAIERNPANITFVGGIVGIAIMISYLDMLFFSSVRKAHEADMDKIRKASESLRKHVRNLLEGLYAHLNRGPFKTMYMPEDAKEGVPEEFVRDRFTQVLTEISEEQRFETIEEGLLYGIWRRLNENSTIKEKLSAAGREIRAFAGVTAAESPAMRAYQRLVKAVARYTDDPDVFEKRVMKLTDGTEALAPAELLRELYSQNKADKGDQLATRFRDEMRTRITGQTEEERSTETLAERVNALLSKITQLTKTINIHNEDWVLQFLDLQDEVKSLLEERVMSEGEQSQRERLQNAYQSLLQKLTKAVETHVNEVKSGEQKIKDNLREDYENDAILSYGPEFERLEKEVAQTRYVVHPNAFASEVNPYLVVKTIDARLERIKELPAEIKKLQPPVTSLRARKAELLDECARVQEELEAGKQLFESTVSRKVFSNRRNSLIGWINNLVIKPGDKFDKQRGEDFLIQFADLYTNFYRGADPFYVIKDSGGINEANLSKAFESMARDLRDKPESFGLDIGMNRTFDPAWKIGTALQNALITSGSKTEIDIPKPLPPIKSLTQRP